MASIYRFACASFHLNRIISFCDPLHIVLARIEIMVRFLIWFDYRTAIDYHPTKRNTIISYSLQFKLYHCLVRECIIIFSCITANNKQRYVKLNDVLFMVVGQQPCPTWRGEGMWMTDAANGRGPQQGYGSIHWLLRLLRLLSSHMSGRNVKT